jgi:hypothetical protein
MEEDVELVAMSFLSLDVFSAITFSIVLIHFALMPTFGPISRQKKESCQSSSDYQFLACVQHPIECTYIICDTQDNWVWVIVVRAIFQTQQEMHSNSK